MRISFFLLFCLISIKSYSQEFYSFSNKAGGDFSENGKITATGTFGAGNLIMMGIAIKSSTYLTVEYGFKNVNVSVGLNILNQIYADEYNSGFEFNDKRVTKVLGFYFKKSFYPSHKRLSYYGALGPSFYLKKSKSVFYGVPSIPFLALAEIGLKYKVSKTVGLLINFYTTSNIDIASGLGLSVSL